MEIAKDLKGFFDKEGKLKVWPAKPDKKEAVIIWLARKFEEGREYSEKEVSAIINDNHSFSDHPLLRRELYDRGYLDRTPNGLKYWLTEKINSV